MIVLPTVQQLSFGALFAVVTAYCSYVARFLTRSGAIAAAILGSIIFGIGGIPWALPLLGFFFLSSVLSKTAKRFQPRITSGFEKSEQRDARQVIANGGIGGLLALASLLLHDRILELMYAGSLAAVTADTWGTEIGILLRGKPVDIRTFHPVEPGVSGGVSLVGIAGGIVGAICIGVASVSLLGMFSFGDELQIVAAGLAGSLVDSYLGSRWQLQYRCPRCGGITERTRHCQTETRYHHGYRWMDNDAVNFICSLGGSAVPVLFWLF